MLFTVANPLTRNTGTLMHVEFYGQFSISRIPASPFQRVVNCKFKDIGNTLNPGIYFVIGASDQQLYKQKIVVVSSSSSFSSYAKQ